MPSDRLFELRTQQVPGAGEALCVNLHNDNRFLPPAILGSERFAKLAEKLDRPLLLLEGRNAAWLYAAVTLAAIARRSDVVVAVCYPEAEAWVVVQGDSPGPGTTWPLAKAHPRPSPACAVRRMQTETAPGRLRLSFAEDTGRTLVPSLLGSLGESLGPVAQQEFRGLVYWDGPIPVWFFAALAAWLWRHRPTVSIGINSPQEGGIVVVSTTDPRWAAGTVLPVEPGRRTTLRVGIVGDPNSGKSVLSWKLCYALQAMRVPAYRFDADVAAPSARWAESEYGTALRKKQKREWNDSDDTPMLVARLRNLKRSSLLVALVDLPGGDHRTSPPLRIPPLRRDLFREIDAFIIVQKTDEIAQAWRCALREAGVGAPVIAEVLSRLPSDREQPRLAGDEQSGRWLPGPLTRETVDQNDDVVTRLAGRLKDWACQQHPL